MPVYGPYFDKASGRWRVRFTDETGKTRSKSFPTEAEARSAMEELDPPRERPSKPHRPPAKLPGPPGASQWWRAVLSQAAQDIIAAQAQGGSVLRDAQGSARCLASLGIAAGKHADMSEIERRLDELEGGEEHIRRAKRYGPRGSRMPRPSKSAPVPGTPLD